MAIEPVRWPAVAQWRAVLVRTWKEAGDDNVGFLAAGVAFYAFLAFVPLLASVVLVYGLAADPQTVAEHIGKLFATLPRDAAALIADQLKSLTSSPQSSKGFGLAIALALAVYGASKGASGVVTALNIAYELKETRSFIKTTALALAMTLGSLLVLILAIGAISATAELEREQAEEAKSKAPQPAALPAPAMQVPKALPAPARPADSKAPLAGLALVAAALGFKVWRRRRKQRGDGLHYGADRLAPLASRA